MKKSLALVLIFAIMFSLVACGFSKNDNGDKTDNPASGSTLVKEKELNTNAYIHHSGCLVMEDGLSYKFADLDGNINNDTAYSDFEAAGNSYLFAKSADTGLWGIIDCRTGSEVVPCQGVCVNPLSDRFSLICYSTGDGTKEMHFGYYKDEKDNETIYFKGYGKVFDCVTGVLVPNLTFDVSADSIDANASFIFENIEDRLINAYTHIGTLCDTYEAVKLTKSSSSFLAMKNFVDDEFLVIGKNQDTIGRIFDQIPNFKVIDGSDTYLLHSVISLNGPTKYEFSDLHGNIISRCYDKVETFCDDKYIIAVDSQTKKYGVDCIDKTNLIPFEFEEIHYLPEGFFQCRNSTGWYLFNTSGKQINTEPFDGCDGLLTNLSPDNYTSVLFLDGTISNCYGKIEKNIDGIVQIGNALYNTKNGDLLLNDVVTFSKINDKFYVESTDKKVWVYTLNAQE